VTQRSHISHTSHTSHGRLGGDTPRTVRERRRVPPYLRFVDPSSLVFAAIVGVWAAYLVPHWLHRRDQLVDSPEDDRDSVGIRVLARRTPVIGRRIRSGGAVLTAPTAATVPVDTVPAATSPAGPARTAHKTPARHPRPQGMCRPPAVVAAQRRARVLLVLVVANVVAWSTVAVAGLPWWAGLTASGLLLLDLVGLRASARRRAAARTTHRRASARGRAARAAQRPAGTPSRTAPAMPAAAGGSGRPERAGAVHDDRPDTWVPVPVPPPVYTLKPVARRPEPPPLPPARPAAVREVAAPEALPPRREPVPQLDVDAALDRRRAVNL